ncbi:MAG: hypothetical protein QNJ90_00635, partial [Planctomycetota bacterium]|nr:hypothetical protein [Planctomycetota bacterium]
MNHATQTLADDLARTGEPHRRRHLLRATDFESVDLIELVRAAARLRKQDPEGARRVATGALLAARQAANQQAERSALKCIADVHLILGQPRIASRRYAALRAMLPPARAARVGLTYSQTLSMLARFDEALEVIQESRLGVPQRGTASFRARLDIAEGLVHQAQGRSAEALARYERGRRVLARKGATEALSTVDMNRATALTNIEEYDKAERLYRRVRRAYEERGVRPMALRTAYNHAYLRFVRGQFHDALQRFRRLRDEFQTLPDRRHVAMCDLDEAEI